jgi:hypothetical protein
MCGKLGGVHHVRTSGRYGEGQGGGRDGDGGPDGGGVRNGGRQLLQQAPTKHTWTAFWYLVPWCTEACGIARFSFVGLLIPAVGVSMRLLTLSVI